MSGCYERVVRSLNDLVNHKEDPKVGSFLDQMYLRYGPGGVEMREGRELARDAKQWEDELRLMLSAKTFDIPNEVGYLMEGTENEPHEVRLPFETVFLDVEFQVKVGEQAWRFAGILLLDDWQPAAKGVGTILAIAFGWAGEKPFPYIIDLFFTIGPGAKADMLQRHQETPRDHLRVIAAEQRKLENMVMNFCDLLESKEDVRLVHVDSTERRQRQGRPTLGAVRTLVRLAPSLRAYVDQAMSGLVEWTHRWDVMGHWYHYRSERWSPELRGTRRWVPPQIRGMGPYVPKTRVVPPGRAAEVSALSSA